VPLNTWARPAASKATQKVGLPHETEASPVPGATGVAAEKWSGVPTSGVEGGGEEGWVGVVVDGRVVEVEALHPARTRDAQTRDGNQIAGRTSDHLAGPVCPGVGLRTPR